MAQQAAFGTAVLVLGTEGLLADRHVAARLRAAAKERPDAEVSKVEASSLEGNRFSELTGGSLFASSNVVVINDLANLPAELFDVVIETAKNPGPDLCLTLVHGGGQKGRGLVDKLKKAKVPVLEAVAPKAWKIPEFLSAEARSLGVGLDEEAAQSMVDAIGTDLRSLAGAMSQLASDNEGQRITREVVQRYFGGRAEVSAFAVCDDILAGRPGPAFEKLRWALSTGVAPVMVTSAFAGSLRTLGKYLDLRSGHLSDAEMAREIGCPFWKVKDVARQARVWSPAGVSAAVRAVARADAQVKGAASSADFALEQMLLAVNGARSIRR